MPSGSGPWRRQVLCARRLPPPSSGGARHKTLCKNAGAVRTCVSGVTLDKSAQLQQILPKCTESLRHYACPTRRAKIGTVVVVAVNDLKRPRVMDDEGGKVGGKVGSGRSGVVMWKERRRRRVDTRRRWWQTLALQYFLLIRHAA